MKTLHTSRLSRLRRLPALWWVFAWAMLAIQGVASSTPQCEVGDTASSMESSISDMSDHSAMPMTAQSGAHSSDCEHCHSHTQGHGCVGFHGCSTPLAALTAPWVSPSFTPLSTVLLPEAFPRLSTLDFEPPLRPPPA